MKNKNAFHGGTYSLIAAAIVLAILVAVNVLAASLPTAATKYDISAAQLYSVTSNTKVVVNALEKDVTIYWIVQADKENAVLENLLGKYESLSPHIQVVKKNPDVFPTFAEQYTKEEVLNNSLVVKCGDRSRYISYDDIYLQSGGPFTAPSDFDGEGAITSAIDYVVSEDFPQLYILEGHGELELPANFTKQLEKDNIETHKLSLLNIDAIPEDADAVMLYAPASDIAPEERDMLADYAKNGGKLLVLAGPVKDGKLANLYSLLEDYGVKAEDGVVVEGDRSRYVQYPNALLPNLESSPITDSLIEEKYLVILPTAMGLNTKDADTAVTPLLTTSEQSFSKAAGFGLTTFDKEDADVDGPFAVGVSINCGNEGKMVWFSSSQFLDEGINMLSSGANGDLTMNALSSLIGEREAMAIRSKSLNYNYLTISDSTASLLKVVMIGLFPLVYLGIGVYMVMRRRRMQNETV